MVHTYVHISKMLFPLWHSLKIDAMYEKRWSYLCSVCMPSFARTLLHIPKSSFHGFGTATSTFLNIFGGCFCVCDTECTCLFPTSVLGTCTLHVLGIRTEDMTSYA